MKKILTLAILASTAVMSHSQNQGLIQSTQFPVNTYMLNPAYAGSEEYGSLQAGYKKNWATLGVAPQTMYLSGHTRLQKEGAVDVKRTVRKDTTDPTNFTLPVRGRSVDKYNKILADKQDSMKIQNSKDELAYQKIVEDAKEKLKYRSFAGVGGNVINEQTGSLARTGLSGTFAYHFWLSKKVRLAFGASVGVASYNAGSFTVRDANDGSVPEANSSVITPDLNVGTYLYMDNFYLGISAFTLVTPNIIKDAMIQNKLSQIYMATTGYRINLSKDLSVTPAVLVRYSTLLPLGIDFNARVNYKNLWGGITYRNQDAIAAMFGVNIAKVFDISYSYDFTLGAVSQYTRAGGHEVVLGYRIQRRKNSLVSRLFN